MDLGIAGKKALITGASSGLGLAAAMALAAEGADVAINSRSPENLEKAGLKIKKQTGREPQLIVGDLARSGEPEKIIDRALSALDGLDILVSNAGGPPAGTFLQHDRETWIKAADLTLHSAINMTRRAIPVMKEAGWGRIIYITSVAVKQPIDNLLISNTYRAGLTGFAKSISREFAKNGITVNTVLPGYTETERLTELAGSISASTGIKTGEVFAGWTADIPAGRIGQPEELAALIAFLASEKASFITGTSIQVDGGYIKGLL